MAAIPNAQLTIEVTDPTSVTTRTTTITDANGAFTITFTADIVGGYAIEAEYDGDANNASTESTLIINVVAPVQAPTSITLVAPTSPVAQGTAVVITGVLSTV